MAGRDSPQVVFGPFRLDRTNRRLLRGVSVVSLRPKSYAVLDYLIGRAGRLVTKDQLLSAVWPDTAVTDTVLKVCVREIRDALGENREAPRFIETTHRAGYRFIGDVATTNLPTPASSFVGRCQELHDLPATLERVRLLTLTGAGGSGKTRLALEVARSLAGLFEDGVWWVDLGPLADESLVPQAIASALGVREQPGRSLEITLNAFLSSRVVLLVIDNCEHLVAACAPLLSDLLRAAPRLRVLATSREPLRVDGETTWSVPPLSLPASGAGLTPDQLLDYEAIQLFVERATAALPSFALSRDNQPAVTEICRRLDGLPLALELAAARLRAFSPEEIAARLDDGFRVVASGHRAQVARHQTLQAAIDWSHELLSDDERCLLRRLSVFAGTFTLNAAEQVAAAAAGAPGEVFGVLGQLVDKSLLFVAEREGTAPLRYRLLETVRQYSYERLVASEDAPAVVTRHLDHYLWLAEAVEPRINTAERQVWLSSLERDHANLRIAFDRAVNGRHLERALRLASALSWFWFHRGHWSEGRTSLGLVIARERAPTRARARALLGDGLLAWAEGDYTAARPVLDESADIARTVDDLPTAAHALQFAAMVRLAQGDLMAGRPLAEESVRLARMTNDAFCLTTALASWGVLLLTLEEYDEASVRLQESVARAREAKDRWAQALPLRNLAIIACRRRDYAGASALLEESLRGLRDLGEKWFVSRSLETLAEVNAGQGEYERAARLFGAAEALRDAVGAGVLAFYRVDYDPAISATRANLGAERFERASAEGRDLPPDRAIAYALAEPGALGSPDIAESA